MAMPAIWRIVALMTAVAFALMVFLGSSARAGTPTPANHNAHHATPAPATTSTCDAFGRGTPTGGMMTGTPMAGMEMPAEFDLMFLDMMLAHHQGAVAMAEVTIERAEHPEVRDLAQQIIDAQQAEIEQLRAWRDAWYPDTPAMPVDQMSGMMSGMDMGGTMGTPGIGMGGMMDKGMLDPQMDAQSLCTASGPFDQAFLTMMIPHHERAIAMAEVAIQRATHQEIKDLAETIINAQQAEIDRMQTWLTTWYGSEAAPTS